MHGKRFLKKRSEEQMQNRKYMEIVFPWIGSIISKYKVLPNYNQFKTLKLYAVKCNKPTEKRKHQCPLDPHYPVSTIRHWHSHSQVITKTWLGITQQWNSEMTNLTNTSPIQQLDQICKSRVLHLDPKKTLLPWCTSGLQLVG